MNPFNPVHKIEQRATMSVTKAIPAHLHQFKFNLFIKVNCSRLQLFVVYWKLNQMNGSCLVLAVRGNQSEERRSTPIYLEDSDAESVYSYQSSISTRSVISTKSVQSTKSLQSDRSAKSVQSRVTAQSSRSAQSGTSVQASKSAPAGRSFRPLRSLRKNQAVDHTKAFKCDECGKVTFLLKVVIQSFFHPCVWQMGTLTSIMNDFSFNAF